MAKTLVAHASPMTLTMARWFIAVIVLIPLVWWKEKKLVPAKAALVPLLFMGITGVALFNIFQFLALERTTSTNAGLISTMNTMSIALFHLLFSKKNKWLAAFGYDSFFHGGGSRPFERRFAAVTGFSIEYRGFMDGSCGLCLGTLLGL